MSVKIVYSTEGLLHGDRDNAGTSSDPYLNFFSFASLEAAKAAPFPEGYTFASIQVENGCHTYSKHFGWEFHNLP